MPTKPVEKKKLKLGKFKNIAVLGVVAVGGYLAYKRWVAPELKDIKNDVKNAAQNKPNVPAPDMNGPPVTKFMIASTKSNICISTPDKRFVYAPISSTNQMTGYKTFSSTANGHYTRRLLCVGAKKWAEIRPT